MAQARLAGIDYAIMAVYFAIVLGIGIILRRSVHTGNDFFLAGRAVPAWIA